MITQHPLTRQMITRSMSKFHANEDLIYTSYQDYPITVLGNTPERYLETVSEVLARGADPNYCDYENQTPLSIAVEFNCVENVKLLLQGGADIEKAVPDPDSDNEYTWTPLFNAIRMNNYNVTKLLLEHGADPNRLNNGITALCVATEMGNLEIMSLLS